MPVPRHPANTRRMPLDPGKVVPQRSVSIEIPMSLTTTDEAGRLSQRILIIEDDQRLGEMVREYLVEAGYDANVAMTGADGLNAIKRDNFDALVLDLMLPDMDGLDVCRQIRVTQDLPIIMLTARGDAMDRVVGLEIGADDYLPKPFEPRELLARLKAILRRSGAGSSDARDVLRFGALEIDKAARRARLDGKDVQLTSYQFALLLALSEHAGRVMSRDQIMDLMKGEQFDAFDRSIDVHISRLRQSIEDDPKTPRRIITVRGAGYVFAKSQE